MLINSANVCVSIGFEKLVHILEVDDNTYFNDFCHEN